MPARTKEERCCGGYIVDAVDVYELSNSLRDKYPWWSPARARLRAKITLMKSAENCKYSVKEPERPGRGNPEASYAVV